VPKDRRDVVKTLIDTFRYPRRGPGMMWETCAERVKAMGGEIRMGETVTGLRLNRATGRWTITYQAGRAGRADQLEVDHVISSAPIRQLVAGLEAPMSAARRAAATALRYRDFLTVVLILKDRGVVSDNWIYVH